MRLTNGQKEVIEKVRKVDPFAANWLVYAIKHRPDLLTSEYGFERSPRDLTYFFVWGETPQRHAYWSEIYSLMEG